MLLSYQCCFYTSWTTRLFWFPVFGLQAETLYVAETVYESDQV